LPPQSANNPSPKNQKQPKPSLSKMRVQLFFFYHTTKNIWQKSSTFEAKTTPQLALQKDFTKAK